MKIIARIHYVKKEDMFPDGAYHTKHKIFDSGQELGTVMAWIKTITDSANVSALEVGDIVIYEVESED
jgi:hypothetical protein